METKSARQITENLMGRYQIELPRWKSVRSAKYLHDLSENALNVLSRVSARKITRVLPESGTIIEAHYAPFMGNKHCRFVPIQYILFQEVRGEIEFKFPRNFQDVLFKMDEHRQTVRFGFADEIFEIGYSHREL